jgi:hypothetical protein
MKYLKKFEGNEFTKIATHLMGDIDSRYKFSSPNDKTPLTMCSVEYPDGVIINYNIIERYYSDTETIFLCFNKISNDYGSYDSDRLNRLYITMYGDTIQFETFEEYKRIRFYMNVDDIYDVNFSCYACPPEGVKGFTEVNLKFIKPNNTVGIKKNGPWPNSPVAASAFMNNILGGFNASKIAILKSNRLEIQHRFVEILEEIELSGKSYLTSHKIEISGNTITLSEYLYFYYTFIEQEELIYSILKAGIPIISNNDIYKTIMKIHY